MTGSIGLIFINAYQHGTTPSVVSSIFDNLPGENTPQANNTFQPMIGAANGWLANMNLAYKLFADTRLGFTASHATTPTLFGQLNRVESLATTVDYDINHSSSFSLRAQFSHTRAGASGGAAANASDFFTASANYSYKLTREWNTNLSYTYRQRHSQSGLTRSNDVLFRLVHDFTLFGKPPAATRKTPSELAEEDIGRAQLVFPGLVQY